MRRRRKLVAVALALAGGCVGEYTDTYISSESNCLVTNYADFRSYGYQLFHSWPRRCPIYWTEQSPWLGGTIGFQGTIVAPIEAPSDVINHDFRNWNGAPVGTATTIMRDAGGRLRGDINTYYTAATVPTSLFEFKSDYAFNTPSGISGYAQVGLPYTATRVIAQAPLYAEENEFFQLMAYPVGVGLAEPVTYQWFMNDQEYGDPTTSNYQTAWVSGSGFTVVFRVDATDANGVVTSNKAWVTIPANCASPPCPAQ